MMKLLGRGGAPAKLNLILRVTGRRTDGYHLLQMLNICIDLYDSVELSNVEQSADSIEITFAACLHERISAEEQQEMCAPGRNSMIKAVAAFRQEFGLPQAVHIKAQKNIPSGAGLGGGSSDAALVLRLLAEALLSPVQRAQSLERLSRIALALGADVPFFLGGRNAWVEGVGEQLQPIDLPAQDWLVVKPAAGLETAKIFGHPDLGRDTKPATLAVFAADPYGFGRNDLQPVASLLCHEVGQALDWLSAQGLDGRMTGSGSAVFARCASGSAPVQVPDHWQVRQCCNMAVHPLAGWTSSDN